MIDVVLRVQTSGSRWLVQVRGARAFVEPLGDADLARVSSLPECARTWDGLLDHLGPNDEWRPDERTLTELGRLLRDRLVVGDVAAQIAADERDAQEERWPLRYVVHVFEGEEDGLLPRLPFELLHDDSFWFRRSGVVGVRRAPKGREAEVVFGAAPTAIVAWASMPDRRPDDSEMRRHASEVAAALKDAGFVPRVLHACTPGALRDALKGGCELLYVACHGNEDWDSFGRLALNGGQVTGSDLGEWIEVDGRGKRRVQAALLCACSSAAPGGSVGTMGMAQHLASGDRRAVAALGFRTPVEVSWALMFMARVFHHLRGGIPLEHAVSQARQAEPARDPQWALPLLFVRERDPAPWIRSLLSPWRPYFGARERHPPALVGESPMPMIAERSSLPTWRRISSLLPPRPRPYFTAREHELEALWAWRQRPGAAVLTAIAGEGGIGKTEIARHVAWDADDEGVPVIWLDRADRDVAGALITMIRQMRPDYQPEPTATIEDLRAVMTHGLGGARGLLVLDDVRTGGAVTTHLTPSGSWNVLVTSRNRSVLPGVAPIEVGPLAASDAMRLLARLVYDADDIPAEEAGDAGRLVDGLGGLPLAIEVASELLRKGHTVAEVLEGVTAARGVVHEVIAQLLRQSLDLLHADDLRAWFLVAVLPAAGVNDKNLAAGMKESVGRAARRLFRLHDASLLRFDPARLRYTMHPLARQVARTRAGAEGVWDNILSTAAAVVVQETTWCLAPLGSDSSEARRRWDEIREFVDSLAVSQWPVGAPGADAIAEALVDVDQFRTQERLLDDRASYLEEAIRRGASPTTRGRAHQARGDLRVRRADLTGAEADYALALELFTGVQENHGLAHVYKARGDLRVRRDDLAGAEADYALALELYTGMRDKLGLANVHKARGDLRMRRDDLAGAEADYMFALEPYTSVRDKLGLANVHKARGDLHVRRGDLAGAEADYARAMELFRSVQSSLGQAYVHKALGDLRVRRGDLASAEADYARALELFTSIESKLGLAHVHKALGDLRVRRADLTAAEADYAFALGLYTGVRDNLGLAYVHKALGDLRVRRADLSGAEADYTRALELFTGVQSNLGLANVHQARGDLRRFRADLSGAEADYARALELFMGVRDNLGLANVHKARGDLLQETNQLDAAEGAYELALSLYVIVGDALGQSNVVVEQARVAAVRGDLERVLALVSRAEPLAELSGNRYALAMIRKLRGRDIG